MIFDYADHRSAHAFVTALVNSYIDESRPDESRTLTDTRIAVIVTRLTNTYTRTMLAELVAEAVCQLAESRRKR